MQVEAISNAEKNYSALCATIRANYLNRLDMNSYLTIHAGNLHFGCIKKFTNCTQ